MVWSVSPEIFELGPLSLRWYGLLFALGFVLSYLLLLKVFRAEGKKQVQLDRLLLFVIVGTVVGARLGHCLFYEPGFYLSNPIEILKVWKGGLASHGGAIGILVSLVLFTIKDGSIRLGWLLDRMALPIPLAGGMIRIGNLMNSEIVGVPTDVPWAIVFTRIDMYPRHPSQLYEAFAYFSIAGLLWLLYRKGAGKFQGMLFGVMLAGIFSARFVLEYFKADQTDFESDMVMSMGQLLSIPFVVVGIYLLLRSFKVPKSR